MAGKKPSWQERYWLLLAGMLILALSFGAMIIIWKNIQDMEKKRWQEHHELAQSIGETAKTFLISQQYDYFLEILQLIKKTSFIDHIAVSIDGRTALQAGAPRWAEGRGDLGAGTASFNPRYHQVRETINYQNGKRAEMRVTFSLEEFRKPKLNMMTAFAVIIILLICLAWVGFSLYRTHHRLVLAEKTKENMIYSITHDAKQDLFVIQGKVFSLLAKTKKGASPVNLEKDLKITLESADAIDRYLNNLKDQQGLAKGKVEIMREPVHLHEVIYAVAEAFAEKMNMRNMQTKIGHLETSRTVSVDPQVIKRVLMNLMHNALKYSPLGGVVSIWQDVRDGWLHTYVRDQGQGIPRQDWERIFQPYVQLDSKKDGMGLGLANARQLVGLFNGRLEVQESVVGQGTTMIFSLPLEHTCPN